MIKRFSKFKKAALLGAATFTAAVIGVISFTSNSLTSASDCSDNSIIRCGVSSAADIVSRLKNNDPTDLRSIYRAYNLYGRDYDNFVAHSRTGKAYRNGTVVVDGRVVIRDGKSLGRQAKSYSHPKVINVNGTNVTYHESRLGDVFLSDGLPVVVYFNERGVANTVIMNDCGNPITGNPEEPQMACNRLYRAQLDRDTFAFSSNVTANNGATIHHVTYDFGDGSAAVDKTNPAERVEHTYARPGTYTAKLNVYVSLPGNQTYTIVPAGDCVRETVVEEEKTPAVSIDKVVNGKEHETVEVNKPFTYTLTVRNTGEVTLKNVKVSDPAPANVQFVSADKGSIAANKWNYTISELKTGESMKFNIIAKLTKVVEGTIKNTACVDAPEVSGNPDDCDDATIDTPKKNPVVSCDLLTVTSKANTFTFKTDYTVRDAEFIRVLYVVRDKATGEELYRGENNVYSQSKPGNYYVVAFVVARVDDMVKTVSSPACSQHFTVENPAQPGVNIDKKVDGVESKQVVVGQNFTYQLVVKNTGNVTLKNVAVSDPAPANVQFLSADKGTVANNEWSHTIPELKVGESMTFAITAKITAQVEGNIVNTACVNAPEVNPNEPQKDDDCDDATVNVPPVVPTNPNISITKTVNDTESITVGVGETFTYKLVVKNTGDVTMKQVVVRDDAPEGVTLLGASLGTVSGNMWTYTIPELKQGESVEVTMTAKVASYVAGVLVNTACVNAPEVNPNEPSKDDACDTANVTVTPPVTPQTPQTPEVLPNTGVGSVIGLFGLATLVGAAIYRRILSRKFAD